MQMLYDFLPIVLFFVIYKIYGIYAATASAMIIAFIQMAVYRIRHKKFETLQVVTFVLIAILGSMTIVLHNPLFIKWKPTVINWAFALIFAAYHLIKKQPFIQLLLGKKIDLPEAVWNKLNISWIIFFIIIGIINLFVAYRFSTDTWVNFKLFGVLGLTIVFVIVQSIFLARHIHHEK